MRAVLVALVLCAAAALPAAAQVQACTQIDSITVSGTVRMTPATVLARSGLVGGQMICVREVQAAVENLYATGQVSDVEIFQTTEGTRQILMIEVTERPEDVVADDGASIEGADRGQPSRDRVGDANLKRRRALFMSRDERVAEHITRLYRATV